MTITSGSTDAGLLLHYVLFFALGGAVLVWHPLFCRIIWLVYPCRCQIIVVASILGGASRLRGVSLVVSRRLILVRVGCF